MTAEEGKRIYSDDFADLIINYSGDESVFREFANSSHQIIDFFYAVVHVPVEQITPNTVSQMGAFVMPVLSGLISQASLEASGIAKIRSFPRFNLRGQGVLIGILDTGIDYTNPIFQYADHTTRIRTIWDQTIYGENYQSNTYYGTEYTSEQINQALQSDNPYAIVPSRDEVGHGTMIAGIAAGNEVPEQGFSGVVPDAELVVVKLKPAKKYLKNFWKIPEDAICFQSTDIIFALEYLEQTANKIGRPMSICIAVGSSHGAHDGSGVLSSNLNLRSENLNFAITTAAGNEGNARRHYSGSIVPTVGFDTVELNIGPNEKGFTMELWGDPPGLFAIDIKTPSGEYIQRILPRRNEHYSISFIFEATQIDIDYEIVVAASGDQLILIRFTNPSTGIWVFKVYGKGDLSLSFNIWLPMEGFISNDTYFIKSNPYTTILAPGNTAELITATAYNTEDASLYMNASKGYTRLGNIKPDLAAPGVKVISPTLDHGFTEISGTSPAAAHTAGAAAMLLEWGIVRGNLPYMSTADVKILMLRGAKRDPNIQYPNREWGYGILDVYNVFDSLRRGFNPST